MAIITGKLYYVKKSEVTEIGNGIAIRAIGGTVTVYGSGSIEDNIASMSDIAPEYSPLTEATYYTFSTLPKYISFVGAATSIEIDGVGLEELKSIS